MRIRVFSDFHDDLAGNSMDRLPTVDADVTVVAGDVMAPGNLAIARLRALLPDASNLIYVPGNHDFYSHADRHHPELRTTYEAQRNELMPRAAEENDVILLDDATVEIEGVRFIGGTLWSSFAARPAYVSFDEAVREASKVMNDYRLIKRLPGRSRDRLRPRDTIDAHKATRRFLQETLAKPFDGETVVVTHHAPSFRSLLGWEPHRPHQFKDLDWCYGSDLELLMQGDCAPALWLHGHVHANRDYQVGATRVVANPRGYPLRPGVRENPDFDPELLLELEPRFASTMTI